MSAPTPFEGGGGWTHKEGGRDESQVEESEWKHTEDREGQVGQGFVCSTHANQRAPHGHRPAYSHYEKAQDAGETRGRTCWLCPGGFSLLDPLLNQ